MDDPPDHARSDDANPAAWDQPPRRPPDRHAAPVLSVDGFEGPLDWLLEMVRARKIDIARISILALVEAFEDALAEAFAGDRSAPQVEGRAASDLARWGDWLVMAADLALLRSRLMLPADSTERRVAQSEAEALRNQLVRRAQLSAVADWLDQRVQLGRDVFARGAPEAGTAPRSGRVGDITALLRGCLAALRVGDEAAHAWNVPVRPFWTVAEAMGRIRGILPELGAEGGGLGRFLPGVAGDAVDREMRCRVAVASTFVAGLELARGGELHLVQSGACSTIFVSAGG